eukprot:SAG11_NODE_2604_length_3179_cov_2.347078_3_plen_395_part_00
MPSSAIRTRGGRTCSSVQIDGLPPARIRVRHRRAFFDDSKTGELLNRLSNDTQVMQSSMTQNISMFLRSLASAFLAMGLMLTISAKLTLAVLMVVPLLVCGAATYGRFVRRLSKQVQDALAEATESAEESLGNLYTVRAFSKERYEIGNYSRSVHNAYSLGRTMALAGGAFMGGVFLLGQGAAAFVLWLGGRLVMESELSIGQLTSFMLFVVMTASSLAMLSGVWPAFMTALGASDKVFYLIDRCPTINFEGGHVPQAPGKGEIKLEGVWFHYPPPVALSEDQKGKGKGKGGKGGGVAGKGGAKGPAKGKGKGPPAAEVGIDIRPSDVTGAPLPDDDPQWVLRDITLTATAGDTMARPVHSRVSCSFARLHYCHLFVGAGRAIRRGEVHDLCAT